MYFSNLATYKGLKRREVGRGERTDEEIQEKEKMLEFLLCVVSVWYGLYEPPVGGIFHLMVEDVSSDRCVLWR
jgi:hypothetical protein